MPHGTDSGPPVNMGISLDEWNRNMAEGAPSSRTRQIVAVAHVAQ